MGESGHASTSRPARKSVTGLVVACAAVTVLAACGTTVPRTATVNGSSVGTTSLGTASGDAQSLGSDEAGQPAGQSDLGQSARTGSTTPGAGTPAAADGRAAATGTQPVTAPVGGSTNAGGASAPGTVTGGGKRTGTKPGTTATKPGSSSPSGTTKSSSSTAPKPGSTVAAGVANGPGITATTINIGVVDIENAGAAEAGALGSSVTEGNIYSYDVAVANYVNSHGGIGGRQIVLRKYVLDATSTMTADQQDQAVCSQFTQDDPIFGFLDAADANLRACFAKAHVVMLGDSSDSLGAQEYKASPTYVDVGANTPEDEVTNLVASLSKTDYFTTRWSTTSGAAGGVLPVKLGILLPNLPRWQNAVTNYLLPALKAKGISIDASDVIQYPYPKSTSDDATAVSAIDAAVLQFSSDSVTDLIPVEFNGLGFFAAAAGNQKYYPRYALETSNEAQYGETSGVIPPATLNGAVGFGELPLLDLTDAGAYDSPALKACTDLMTAAGINNASGIALITEVSVCDQFFLLRKAVAGITTGQGITDTAVVGQIEALGSSFPVAALPAARFAPNKHFPAVTGYPMAWDTGCTCVKYTGAAFTLG